jgi:hypothetical protein
MSDGQVGAGASLAETDRISAAIRCRVIPRPAPAKASKFIWLIGTCL